MTTSNSNELGLPNEREGIGQWAYVQRNTSKYELERKT